jgi:hypothetical protein
MVTHVGGIMGVTILKFGGHFFKSIQHIHARSRIEIRGGHSYP